MKLTECPACHAPVRTVLLADDLEPPDTSLLEVHVDPRPSLHGTIRIVDLAAGIGQPADRRAGQYRPHYETCRGRA